MAGRMRERKQAVPRVTKRKDEWRENGPQDGPEKAAGAQEQQQISFLILSSP